MYKFWKLLSYSPTCMGPHLNTTTKKGRHVFSLKNNTHQSYWFLSAITEQLVKHHYVAPPTVLDEMKNIRSQYRYFMNNILKAAMLKISQVGNQEVVLFIFI